MSLILPAIAFVAIVLYEIFSKDPMGDPPYPVRPTERSRKGKRPVTRHR